MGGREDWQDDHNEFAKRLWFSWTIKFDLFKIWQKLKGWFGNDRES